MKFMKQYFFFLLLGIASSTFGQDDYYNDFEISKTYYLFGDSVNIRSDASTTSKIITKLPIATPIVLIEKSTETITLSGYTSHWYKINFKENNVNKSGYVAGKFIATSSSYDKKSETTFLLGVKSYLAQKTGDKQLRVEIRASNNNLELDRLTLKAIGGLYTFASLNVTGPKGIDLLDNVIHIEYSGESCGAEGGVQIIFWFKNKLKYVKRLTDFSDYPYFAFDRFIFPEDKNGKAGHIIFKRESGEYNEGPHEYNHTNEPIFPEVIYTNKSTKTLRWNGVNLINTTKKLASNEVLITNVKELLTHLGSNKTLLLESGDYILEGGTSIQNPHIKSEWAIDSYNLIFQNLKNMTIKALHPEDPPRIASTQFDVTVLNFENCSHILLENIWVGHFVEKGGCGGGCISTFNSTHFKFNHVQLYGSGVFGIEARSSQHFEFKNTKVFECTGYIVDLSSCTNFNYINCEFLDNKCYRNAFTFKDSKQVHFVNSLIKNNDVWLSSYKKVKNGEPLILTKNAQHISFKQCQIIDNKAGAFYHYDEKPVTLDKNTMKNNNFVYGQSFKVD